jgi:8-oxo-dGTP pyrophosphatase MutT (NUDIX family)
MATRETVAKVLVVTDDREVLVLTTGEYKAHPEKEHKPDFPGGLVDPGETEHGAALREVHEEAGIDLEPTVMDLVYAETKFYAAENKSVSKLLYLARIATTQVVTLSYEHEAYEWVGFDTLLDTHELRPFYRDAIEYVQNNQLV